MNVNFNQHGKRFSVWVAAVNEQRLTLSVKPITTKAEIFPVRTYHIPQEDLIGKFHRDGSIMYTTFNLLAHQAIDAYVNNQEGL